MKGKEAMEKGADIGDRKEKGNSLLAAFFECQDFLCRRLLRLYLRRCRNLAESPTQTRQLRILLIIKRGRKINH